MVKESMGVQGMTCGNCVKHVEKALNGVPGVTSVAVSLDEHNATVEFDPALTGHSAMAEAVQEAGYTLEASTA
ncbi:MAG: heavy-metal-associated domain-containing protein [Chloroflexi bacterium]|nr:heavy-metal-associated domain-containing protein [Chloroflexota bacterium]